jgi:tetratricopeptide (TPR) repeat protein
VRGLVRRPINERGRLMVLIGRSTGPAARALLADLERHSEAVFVGEPSDSPDRHPDGGRAFTLPNSRITVGASTSQADSRPWMAPEIAAEMTFADYRVNRDPALEAAMTWKARPSLVQDLRVLVGANDTLGIRMRIALFRDDPANAYQDLHAKLDSVATYFHSRRDLAAATRALEVAANEYPDSVPVQVNLAGLYVETGKKDLARTRLTRALELDPKNESAASMLKRLGAP